MGKERINEDDLVSTYRSLFSGNTSFYGVHKYVAAKKGEKEEGKSWTENKRLTPDLYKRHLIADQGLGVCPIREDSTCAFGAIDVDIYNDDQLIDDIIQAIYKWDAPLLPFRSKSGGLHLYLFMDHDGSTAKLPTGSETIRLLTQLSVLLTIPVKEIFPKQSKWRPGNNGSWINIPYYGMDNSQQYLIGQDNERVAFDAALEIIQEKKATLISLEQYVETLPFNDGPPCLQKITLHGGTREGQGRNVFLFNAAIYFKEKDHTSFDVLLDDLNDSLVNPLEADELTVIKRSVIKKEYTYQCHVSPLCDHCEKEKCATKEYGVGKNNGLFMDLSLGQLTIYRGKGVSYEWEVTYKKDIATIRFDSPRDLRNQDVFIDGVLMALNYKVSKIKQEKWDKILNGALEDADEQEPNLHDENTVQGRLAKMVLEFITKHLTDSRIDIERGLAYRNKDKGEILFKPDDLWKYITETNKQRNTRDADYKHVLSELGIKGKVLRVGKKTHRTRYITIDHIEKILGHPIEPPEDIDWEEQARSEDY